MEIRDTLDELLANVTRLPLAPGWGQGRIIRAFREAGATSPRMAQRFHAHSVFDESAFASLLNQGIIRQWSPGRYYLDEAALRRRTRFPPRR